MSTMPYSVMPFQVRLSSPAVSPAPTDALRLGEPVKADEYSQESDCHGRRIGASAADFPLPPHRGRVCIANH